MKSTFISLLALAATALQVSAHGFVRTVTIDGKSFTGNVPNAKAKSSIVRQINDVSPVKGATNAAVNCGKSAQIAALDAEAQPGSVLTFDWAGGDGSNWPHNTGPMLTYMASCGNATDDTCDKFDSTKAKWFKIQQVGRKSNGDWAQADLMAGGTAKVTLPSNLKAGNYLIRHEIIALHLAVTEGGAEFYPSCSQLKVGGTQTGAPDASDLVSLPGAYRDDDPGIFDKNVFDTSAKYTFPGPVIASFITGSSATPSKSTTASGSTKTSSSCKLKKSATAKAKRSLKEHNANRPRHVSRVMRDLYAQAQV